MEQIHTASLLFSVGRIIRSRMEPYLPISFTQFQALQILEEGKGLTMRAIAEHFKIAAPSATAVVNELVKAGFVKRTENAKDRREVILTLTAKGKKMLQVASISRKKVVSEVLSVLSFQDRKQLDVILNRILVGVELH